MRILIEGPDGAGKTSLAEHLSRELDIPVIHSGGPFKDTAEVEDWMRKHNRKNKPDIILDRHPAVSEQVFGPVLRGYNLLSSLGGIHLAQADLIIYVRPFRGQVRDYTKQQMEGVVENQKKILKAYDQVFAEYLKTGPIERCNLILWNWEMDSDYVEITHSVLRNIRDLENGYMVREED